jgi:hypothetical protein
VTIAVLFYGTLPVREVLLGLSRWAPDALWALECCTEELSESLERFLRGDWGDFFENSPKKIVS